MEFIDADKLRGIKPRSLLFKRTEHAWQGVREIRCPEDKLRKVFIVVFERVRPLKTIKKGLRERFAG